MKKYYLFIILLTSSIFGYTQKIHTPGEIVKMMIDSKLSYEITMLDKTIECEDFSNNLNYHDCYRVSTDSGLFTYKIIINDKAKPFYDKAEKYFSSKDMDSALVYYNLALNEDSTLYNVMTYIGQIYGIKKDYDLAIYWYKKVISKNYIDYMAHWFLADIYESNGDIDNAVDEITTAQILNRNNIRIKEAMFRIFKKAKRNTDDWCFNPQVEINKITDHNIKIANSENWSIYAMAKALWAYEPGYRESMGVSSDVYSTLEDKECLGSMLMGIENAKTNIKNDPQLNILKLATLNKHIDDYIMYEIVLPKNPFVAFQLSEDFILGIKDYILEYRFKK
jgi:tetratricopeptide (TPR) repeat protein